MHVIVCCINVKSTDTTTAVSHNIPHHTPPNTTHLSPSFQEEAPTTGPTPLGVLFLPDAAAVLAPTSSLFFNDAPWLVETGGTRLVHPAIPLPLSEAMNAQSLRFHHQVIDSCIGGGYLLHQ